MTSTAPANAAPSATARVTGLRRLSTLGTWRLVAGGTMMAAAAAIITGCLMPWAEIFAGLIGIPGIRGSNGKILAAVGILIALTGLWHLIRGGAGSRWVAGVAGTAALGFSCFLLMRLSATMHSLGGDSMMAARGGPGLWIVAAGGLAAFATLFLPRSGQRALVVRRPGGGLAAWAADHQSAGPRRWVQVALGVLWVIDAGLQAQPYMFSRAFVTHTIAGAGMGNPAVVSNSIMGVSHILLAHPAAFNVGFAGIQLALGLGLFWRRTARAALAATVAWALWVWWLGEGLGGVLTPATSAVTGAPGAALLYAAIAVVAWPRRDAPLAPPTSAVIIEKADAGTSLTSTGSSPASTAPPSTVAADSPAGPAGAGLIWITIWAGTALLTLLGLVRAPGALRATLAAQAAGEPGWLAGIDRAAANVAGATGPALPIVTAVILLVIAAGALIKPTRRPALILAILAALVFWIAGQDFGGVFTGRGTDPNTGPLLILLAAAYWPVRAGRFRRPRPAAPDAIKRAVPWPQARRAGVSAGVSAGVGAGVGAGSATR